MSCRLRSLISAARVFALLAAIASCAGHRPPAPLSAAPSATPPAAPPTGAAMEPPPRRHAPQPTPPLDPPGVDVTAHFELEPALADRWEVRVWAASPQLLNPTNLDVDHRGRVWVTEAVHYRYSIHPDREGFARRPEGDRVVILEDTDGDGAADASKVFVQDPALVAPLGLSVIPHQRGVKVFVSCSPAIHVYIDADGDDVPEQHEVLLTGFGGVDDDHGVHAVVPGPDGRLYFTTGNQGPHTVVDRDGFTFRKLDDDPRPQAPQSDDGRAWIQGVVLSVRPDGGGLRPIAHNFRNNVEVALDAFGNVFQSDNDDDGNEACRYTFVLPGGNYGYASAGGQRKWWVDRREGQPKAEAHWHADDPGVVPALEITGAGAPGGQLVIEGGVAGGGAALTGGAALPAEWLGSAISADSGQRRLWLHRLAPAGAGFSSRRVSMLAARPGAGGSAHWFRPSDVARGPDGALYVADWYDGMVGGHQILDGVAAGRILRLAPRGQAARAATVDLESVAGALVALGSPAVGVRFAAFEALRARGSAVLPDLGRALRAARGDARQRARLLWLHGALGPAGLPPVVAALRDRDPNLRLTALRILREQLLPVVGAGRAEEVPRFLRFAAPLARDRSPAVRRELALSLRELPFEQAGPLLVALARGFDGQDRIYLEALGIGAQGKERLLYDAVLRGAPDPLRWTPAQELLTWRLHPPASVPGLLARVGASSLPEAARRRALVALAFSDHVDAVASLFSIAQDARDPLSAWAARLVAGRARAEWQALGAAERLAEIERAAASAARDEQVEAARRELATAHGARRVELLAELAGRPEGGRFLIGEATAGRLSEAERAAVGERIFGNPDPSVRALASRYFPRPAFDGAAYPSVTELLAMTGDPERGRAVFFSPGAACASCHEHGGQGRAVGPALTQIGEKLGREALLDAILNPGAAIAFGYTPWVLVTRDQQVFTGFLVSDGETVVLRDVTGELRVLPRAEIVQRERQPGSIMPDNIALGMQPQELVDLVAFLAQPSHASPKEAR